MDREEIIRLSTNPSDTIRKLLPYPIITEIASVLGRGSRKEGKAILNCNRPKMWYFWKFWKHMVRWLISMIFPSLKYDKDSGCHHLTHCIVRLMQLLGCELGVKK